nr:retrovirus-related Pol polyprotein from transposon TNT 1-94 [Tanacetum cinerariifolium]
MSSDMLSKFLLSQEFSKGADDPTLFTMKVGKDILLLPLLVLLFELFPNIISSKFKMSMMGKMSFFLGLHISLSPRCIFINQSKYALEIIKKYSMEASNSVDLPMVDRTKLDKDLQGKIVNHTHYRGMVGSLMYLTSSRPDLVFAVCMYARYPTRPTENHLHADFESKRCSLSVNIIANMDTDEDVTLQDVVDISKDVTVDAEIEKIELQEVVKVVTTTKLMTEVVTTASATITAADTSIPAATITSAAPTLTTAPRIMVHEPKPIKKKTQIEHDEAYLRELEAKLNKIINWDDVIDQVQRKEKEDNAIMRYQALKRKPQTEAQAIKNMMIYLRNMAGLKMDYFKGMTYNDIRPL